MFGTGPFITLPFLIASVTPEGPHALIGYALAAIFCFCDSFVWAELGAIWPLSGGTLIYLLELFGPDASQGGYGPFMSFLFVWQFFISGPLEIASGFVAASQYLSYITRQRSWLSISLVACGLCMASFFFLHESNRRIGAQTVAMWILTIGVIIFTIVAGFMNFESGNLLLPFDAFKDPSVFFLGVGIAGRFGVYDFTGYFDVNQIGGEVVDPKRTIPIACISTAFIIGIVYFLVIISIMGALPFLGDNGFSMLVRSSSDKATFVGAIFFETLFGKTIAIIMTCMIITTILASCISLIVGYIRIPHAAAERGLFFRLFYHLSSQRNGLPDRSLYLFAFISSLCCFADLEILLDAALTTRLVLQFIPQAVGSILDHARNPERERPFRIPLFPLPNLISAVGFFFVFVTTDSATILSGQPLLEVSIGFMLVGACVYPVWRHWSHVEKQLPSKADIELYSTGKINSTDA